MCLYIKYVTQYKITEVYHDLIISCTKTTYLNAPGFKNSSDMFSL